MDKATIAMLKLLGNMGVLTLLVVWVTWLVGRGIWLYQQRKWFVRRKERILAAAYIVVLGLILVVFVRIHKAKAVDQALIRSVRGQTSAMNQNFTALDERLKGLEEAQDAPEAPNAP